MSVGLLALQVVLTNLSLARPGPGVPAGWRVEAGAGGAPRFAVTRDHTLQIQTAGSAGWATLRLREPVRPIPRASRLTWRWRSSSPIRGAALRQRSRDDSPVRVLVVFGDGRSIAYSWGALEGRGERLPSHAGANRRVIVLRRAEDANGSWFLEERDPFADYRLVFEHHPEAIVRLGVGADSDALGGRTIAEVGDIAWQPGGR